MDYVLGRPVIKRNGDAVVRLADDVRRSVAFLGCQSLAEPDRLDPVFGTGFFVGWEGCCYLVTAGHVVDALKTNRDDLETGPFGIRLNDSSGNGRVEHQDSARFHYHDRYPEIDVAVIEFSPPKWADAIAIPQSVFLSEHLLELKDIGPGDLAYVVGLFQHLQGTRRNLPVVHTGHLAGYPGDELIPVEGGHHLSGYLVETNAIPGASGSPVFVRRTLHGVTPSNTQSGLADAYCYGAAFVLGLWAGSWNERIKSNATMPRGMGIVTPAINIIEVLNMPELRDRREKRKAKADKEHAADLSRAPAAAHVSVDDNPKHQEDFSRLLNVAAKKRGPKG